MATPNDTIDPNDLDSIDALLDEAEWNADENLQDSSNPESEPEQSAEDVPTQETEAPLSESPQEIDAVADTTEEITEKASDVDMAAPEEVGEIAAENVAQGPQAELDAMLDEALEEVNSEAQSEIPAETSPEVAEQPIAQTNEQTVDSADDTLDAQPDATATASQDEAETLLDDMPMPVVADNNRQALQSESESEKKATSASTAQTELDDQEVPSRLQRTSKSQTSDLTVEEMDALKKLIIIFGSASLTLIVITLGIAIWAAIAASSAGLSEENQTLLESVKVNSELSSEKINVNYETMESLEKKLDAINYQVEQLAADFAGSANSAGAGAMAPTSTHADSHATPANNDLIDPLGLHTQAAPKTPAHAPVNAPAPVKVAAPSVTEVEVKVNAELSKKVSSVNYKVIKLQKSITELNTRLKAVQSQQANLTDSVKVVEKEILLEKAAKLKAEREMSEQKAKRPYQPGGYPEVFSDPTVGDSYP